jgi:pyruvate dehydrogenase E2 component (dihydrolipoamide acetyltransferase)
MMPRPISYPLAVGAGITRVVEAGTGDGMMICIHGIGSHAGWWRRNLQDLATLGYRVIAADLPGHGFAAASPGWPLTITGYRDFILQLAETLAPAGPVVLAGHSLGGHAAAAAALQKPGLASRLVLVAPTGITPMGEARLRATEQRQSDFSREAIAAKLRFAIADPELVTEDWISEDVRMNTGPGAAAALRAAAAHLGSSLDDHVIGAELADLAERVPTLLVWGDADRSVPIEAGREARGVVKAARFAVLHGAAHVPHYELPIAFAQVVAAFLANSEPDIEDAHFE